MKKSLEILDLFCKSTWMEVNYGKLFCYCHNNNIGLQMEMDAYCPFERVDLSSRLKYIRFFLKPTNYTKEGWYWLIEKLEKEFIYGAISG